MPTRSRSRHGASSGGAAWAIIVLGGAAACATAGDPTDGEDPLGDRFGQPTVRVTDNTGRMIGEVTYAVEGDMVVQELEEAPDVVWPHLLAAYAAFGLTVNVRDEARFSAGVSEHRARRRLGDQPLSRYFSCGRTMTGDVADQANLRIRMASVLRALPEGRSELRTSAAAFAVSLDGAGRDRFDCTSVRSLETAIGAFVAEAVGERE
jgi:hypothetical protein